MDFSKASVRIAACLLLGILALAGNWLKLTLFPPIDFLFGSIFVMLAIMVTGGSCGVVIGIAAASVTYLHWHHPWAIIALTGEALFVSWLYQGRLKNILICDILYWFLLGAPINCVLYYYVRHLPLQPAVLMMLKHSINGIFNALLASIAYGVIQTRIMRKGQLAPFRDLLFTVMVSLVLIPTLVFLMADLKHEKREKTLSLAARVSFRNEITRESISSWINEHQQIVQTLARLIRDPATTPVGEMQHLVETIDAASAGFTRMGVMDSLGTSVAYAPLQDEAGVSTLGVNFLDRSYVPIIKETKQPHVSDIVMGRINPVSPSLPIVAPIVLNEEFKGFCGGVVDLAPIKKMLAVLAGGNPVHISVLDRNRRLVATTRADLQVMQEFHRSPGRFHPVDGTDVLQWMPETRTGRPQLVEQQTQSLLIREQTVSPNLGWIVLVEGPMQPLFQFLTLRAIESLTILSALIIFTVILVQLTSRTMTRRLGQLQQLTSTLPSHLSDLDSLRWPASKISEVNLLVANFQQMAFALAASFHEKEMLNVGLERRVRDRTESLNLANKRLTEAQTITHLGSWDLDLSTNAFACSDEIYRIYEIDSSDSKIAYEVLQGAVHPEDRAMVLQAHERALENRTGLDLVHRLLMRDGRIKYVRKRSETFFAEDGTPQRYLGTVQDITDVRLTEQALRESEKRLRLLLDNVPGLAIQGYEMDGTAIYWNAASEALYGYTANEAIGRNLLDLIIPPEKRAEMEKAMNQMAVAGEAVPASELNLQRKDGSRVAVYSAQTVVQIPGKQPQLYCMDVDLTTRKRAEQERLLLEQRMQQAEKVESLSRMAGGIAHNFNNILTVVMGNLDLALLTLPQESAIRKNLLNSITASRRAAEMSRLMLAYVGQTTGRRELLNVAEASLEAIKLLEASLPNRIHLTTELASQGPNVMADATQLKEILTHLVSNAVEAIGDQEGTISVTVHVMASEDAAKSKCFPTGWKPGAEHYACLSVSDNGCGMDAATQEKIFDPFYSSKFTGRGMGLPMILGMVRAHGGAILVTSQSGRGSSFQVLFPLVELDIPASGKHEPLTEGVSEGNQSC